MSVEYCKLLIRKICLIIHIRWRWRHWIKEKKFPALPDIYIAGKTDIINIKNIDLQIVLKYISDNAGIFLKYFKDEIDDFDTLNLLYGKDGKNVW